jgi:hypothetical protein
VYPYFKLFIANTEPKPGDWITAEQLGDSTEPIGDITPDNIHVGI